MKKLLFILLGITLLFAVPPTNFGYAQEDEEDYEEFFDDEEPLEDEDELGLIDEEDDVEEDEAVNDSLRFKRNKPQAKVKPTPARAKPKPRFGNSSRPSFRPPPKSRSKNLKVRKGKKGNMPNAKMKFADAHPEDINNKNFPDLIESFDYPNADLADVVKAMSKLTGKNMILDKNVSGKITIIAPTQITVAEAWEAFLSALAMNNFTIVPAGKFLKIRRINEAKTDSIETYSGAYYPTSDQLITRIIKLKYINAKDVETSLRNFKSKSGDITAYEETNSLIVSDLGSSVQRISRIISELDKPGFEERLEVLPIRHADAKDIAELIEKIINKNEKKGGSRFSSRSRFNRNQNKNESLSMVAPDSRTNAIMVVGNAQGIERVKKLITKLDNPLEAGEYGNVHVYYVKHGEAKLIAETLSGIAQESAKSTGGSSKNKKDFKPADKKAQIFDGDVILKADETTNSLIISAGAQDYEVVKNLLSKIDIPRDQVFVETIIMEMRSDKKNSWDTGYFNFNGTTKGETNIGASRQGFSGGSRSFGKLTDLTTPGAFLSFGNPDPDSKFTLQLAGQTFEIPNLLGFINILKTYTNSSVLSTPHLLVMDNEEGKIEVGEDVPVGTQQVTGAGAGAAAVSTQFKDAVIGLEIKPFISPDSDIVRMKVKQRIDKVSTSIPTAKQLAESSQGLSKRSIETSLSLRSGDTAVLGGLMQDEDIIEESKVPILGDIPILGWLFKNQTKSKNKVNLIIFLTPKIIRNAFDHKRILTEKLDERVEWIKRSANGRDPHGKKFTKLAEQAKQTAGDDFVPETNETEGEEPIPFTNDSIPEEEDQDDDFGETQF